MAVSVDADTLEQTQEPEPGPVPEEESAITAQNRMAMQLIHEAEDDAAKAGYQHQDKAMGVGPEQSETVWTLDSLKHTDPIMGIYKNEGKTFTFWFKPLLGTNYCQKRLRRADAWRKQEAGSYAHLLQGYADIVYYCLRGGSWALRETVQDEEGNDLYQAVRDEQNNLVFEADGITPKMVLQTVPLAINPDNIDRLTFDQLVAFIDGMTEAMQGEVKGQR